jgi:hypothetical protein
VEYSARKKVRLQPDIVEYSPGDQAPMYDLIIGKQTMHDLGVCVLLDSGSSGDLLFMKKGSSKRISVVKWVVPQSWGISNGTFVTSKVGNIEISFVEYSASKKVCLQPDIVEYSPGDQAPMYDLIIGKQTMHDLGVCVCVSGLWFWMGCCNA